jgi:DNA-binding transcriptional LysR family regulator
MSCGIVQILADWAEEHYPLYAYHPSRNLPPAKVIAFLDFLLASIERPTSGENVTARSPWKARWKKS